MEHVLIIALPHFPNICLRIVWQREHLGVFRQVVSYANELVLKVTSKVQLSLHQFLLRRQSVLRGHLFKRIKAIYSEKSLLLTHSKTSQQILKGESIISAGFLANQSDHKILQSFTQFLS